MESWASLCTQTSVERLISEKICRSELGEHVRRVLNGVVENEMVSLKDVKQKACEVMKTSGVEVQVKNIVYHELMRLMHQGPRPSLHHIPLMKEPLGCVREAQHMWETRLAASISTLSSTLGQPLSIKRAEGEQEVLRKNWSSLGTQFPTKDGVQHLFSPLHLLHTLSQIQNPNFTTDPTLDEPLACVLIKVHLNGKSLYELRKKFLRLHPSNFHIDIQGDRGTQSGAKEEYTEKAVKVVRLGLVPLAQQVCRGGCPVGLRRQLWCLALGVDLSDSLHHLHFEGLRSSIFEDCLLLDRLIVKDVKDVATNNDNYFVFEDMLYQVLLALLRDCSIADPLMSPTHSATGSVKNGMDNSSQDMFPSCGSSHQGACPSKSSSHQGAHPSCGLSPKGIYPPSGIVPFQGFSLYMAPLGYLCDQAEHMYALFGELYKRFFVHLHSISSRPEGVLGLCCVFESLLQTKLPTVCQYLKRVGVEPLNFAFPWMMTAFAGHLSSEQVLLLWDRVIGFNSLEVLPVFAVSIFQFRASNLLQAVSHADVEAILEDLRCLKVLPLLQQTLF